MSKKTNAKESMNCLTPKPSQNFFVNCIQGKENIFPEKELFKEKWGGRLNKNEKKAF